MPTNQPVSGPESDNNAPQTQPEATETDLASSSATARDLPPPDQTGGSKAGGSFPSTGKVD